MKYEIETIPSGTYDRNRFGEFDEIPDSEWSDVEINVYENGSLVDSCLFRNDMRKEELLMIGQNMLRVYLATLV